MNGKGILKKPKTEVESDGEPDIKIEKPNKNISTSGDDDNNNDASTSNYEEQEEALVALIEHRSKEVQHLTNRISYYQTEVFLFFSFIFDLYILFLFLYCVLVLLVSRHCFCC